MSLSPSAALDAEAVVQLYDNLVPPLGPGQYTVTVTHSADPIASAIPQATQQFQVNGPQVTLDPAEITQFSPPPTATGPYADVLASVLLTEPALPWERTMPTAGCPWLAVLVFAGTELSGGDQSTHAYTGTVSDLLAIDDAVVPLITADPDVADDQPCSWIRVPATLFPTVTPRTTELPWLAHVRQTSTGTVGVVLANRFPPQPATATDPPVTAIAHLVSVEGLTPWLVDDPVFTRDGTDDGSSTMDEVVVISLARWTFRVVSDPAVSFEGLTVALRGEEYDAQTQTHTPDNLALRHMLPPGYPPDTSDPGQNEVAARINAGYAPVTYHARSGEETMAWYRGPVTPGLVAAFDPPIPMATCDAALVYDQAYGVFDVSLAAAWQAGRAAALADQAFGQSLYAYRRAAQQQGDAVADRLARAEVGARMPRTGTRLAGPALCAITQALERGPAPSGTKENRDRAARAMRPAPAPTGAILRDWLADPRVSAALDDSLADAVAPVADWLAGLTLLEPLPFACLVPDARMLPRASAAAGDPATLLPGSIRFGYLDPNWIAAATAGALSLAAESGRQAQGSGIPDATLSAAIGNALAARCGLPAPPSGPITVLLLRSDLVSGWPTLAVTPLDGNGALIPVLRRRRLATGVLIALFAGVPATVRIAEPHAAMTLGVDEQGCVELRNLIPSSTPIGTALGVTTPIRGTATCLRGDSLTLAVDAAGGVVDTITDALSAKGFPAPAFGPAALGLHLVRAPQAMLFDSTSGGS